MSEHIVLDQPLREEALSPENSYIVQAPAGSGKTALLIQRYLALLCVVEKPEEILAITFTRKAAAEMRERIVTILSYTADDSIANDENLSAHDQKTLELAWQAQAQNAAREWGILENPARMQILTIDAFCARLVSSMPIGSRFGGMPKLVDDPSQLYQRAINQYFRRFLQGERSEQSLESVLLQLNNSFDRVSDLLKTLLGRRDQWLPFISNEGLIDIDKLNSALDVAIQQDLMPLTHLLPLEVSQEIAAMASYASENLRAASRESEIRECHYLTELPSADISTIKVWKGIRKLLLTDKGKLRSRVSVKEGFPAESSADDADLKIRFGQFKERMGALLERLEQESSFISRLDLVAEIPTRSYTNEDQNFLVSLFSVLKQVTAELMVEFQISGTVDFIELTQSALRALGTNDAPTDLAMIFDARINHILVDEFQDTSRVHMELLRKLTLAWDESQNKSLFVVGDPMQSIYRFRDADVRNFLHVKQRGINAIEPKFIQLESNFRSSEQVVNWNNQAFCKIFPEKDNINAGQIAYSKAQAINSTSDHAAFTLHTIERGSDYEAELVVQLIKELQVNDPDGTIGVLARSRSHLVSIIPILRQKGIDTNLDGMETLAQRQEVLDVFSLCRALAHPVDRKAWLSVLRTPWIGLCLDELEIIASASKGKLIFEIIQDELVLSLLNKESQEKLIYLAQVFTTANSMLFREPLAMVVEGIWRKLDGPSSLDNQEQLANVEKFLAMLRKESLNSILSSENSFDAILNSYTGGVTVGQKKSIQVLTIHMAKGLEFDHVILPGIGKTTRSDSNELLVWNEVIGGNGLPQLLLSNYQESKENSIYSYINKRNKRMRNAELARLLYVALTRSIKSTHIISEIQSDGDEKKIVAPAGSLLRLLQPVFQLIDKQIDHSGDELLGKDEMLKEVYRKVVKGNFPTSLGKNIVIGDEDQRSIAPEYVEYEWASETAMHVGTVVHLALRQLGSGALDQWLQIEEKQKRQHFSRVLKALGISSAELDLAVDKTLQALHDATRDSRGRWILNSEHTEIGNELPISGFANNEFRNYRVDRTFISSDDTRWIIDYKTSNHLGGSLDAFLDNEMQRYCSQLENYAEIFSRIESRNIKLGLYFPLIQGWREWSYEK